MPYKPREGTLFQRSDGRWEARITYRGRQIYIKNSKYKHVCEQALAEAIKKKKNGRFKPPKSKKNEESKSRWTLYEWLDYWMETFKLNKVKEHTYKNIDLCVRLHTKPHMEDCDLKKIDPLKLQEALNKITSSRMREYTHGVLFEAFEKARKLRLMNENPIDFVEIPKHERKPGRALTHNQEIEFIRVIQSSDHKYVYMYQLLSGCRPGEACNAKKEHINYENNTVFIQGSKSENAPRYIPLFDGLKKLLESLPETKGEKLFNSTPGQIKKDFKKIQEKLSFPMTQKDLRHTFATRCMEAGVPNKIIQKWMGHASSKTTEKIYMHVLSEQEQIEARKIYTNFYTNFEK